MLMPTRWLANEGQPLAAAPRRVTEADLDRMEDERESAVSAYLEQRRQAECCDHACDQGRTCPHTLAARAPQAAAAATEVGTDDDDQSTPLPWSEFVRFLALLTCGLTAWAWAVVAVLDLVVPR